ncbi:GtrA family protein [Shewanella canadensis]|uniref:GtrA family protein n=1 Tax=Shewanella canadensis TaxID=271096 RepID=A0A431WZ09_9GAMM|nr:GtrA family protein [Shewanella canadensis]RTR40622.1 GtrA family protein [Shewanella canadensis]
MWYIVLDYVKRWSGLTLVQLKFLLVGGVSFLIDLSLFLYLSQQLLWPLLTARLAAFSVALTLTWLGNRLFTFSHRKKVHKGQQFAMAVILACSAASVNLTVFYLLSELLTPTGVTATIYLALGVLSGLIVNWLGSNYLVFRH